MARIREALPAEVTLVANMVEGGRTPVRTVAALADAGFHLVVLPVAGLLAAAAGLRAVYTAMRRDGVTRAVEDRLLAFDEMNALLGLDARRRREREWLR